MDKDKDGKGNNFYERKLFDNTDAKDAIRISFIKDGWSGKCIRINIKDGKGHIRQGIEIPIEKIEDVVSAIIKLIKENNSGI